MNNQPVYLNLFKIKLPLTGGISFIHRVTGILLFLAIPLCIYLLQRSLQTETGFNDVARLLNHPLMIFLQVIIIGSLLYHLFAGIRFLLMDIDIGLEKKSAEQSSWLVLLATIVSCILFLFVRFF